jgi:hypothetical protein
MERIHYNDTIWRHCSLFFNLGNMGDNAMAETSTIIKYVRDNILDALENDFSFDDYTDEELAGDLIAYAENMENKTFEEVLAAVKAVRAEGIACQKNNKTTTSG